MTLSDHINALLALAALVTFVVALVALACNNLPLATASSIIAYVGMYMAKDAT